MSEPANSESNSTHFGYKTVASESKEELVAGVFHSVAAKYDLMNDLMSAGVHRLWKRFTLELSGVREGHTVLDLAGGTGDLAAKFSRLVGAEVSRHVERALAWYERLSPAFERAIAASGEDGAEVIEPVRGKGVLVRWRWVQRWVSLPCW